jgi:cytochrome P450
MLRVFMPLTHIGRVTAKPIDMMGDAISAGARVSLCWASANMDETVFENPHEVRLDRKPNPHVSFGFGEHLCLGAHHARLIMRSVLRTCVKRVKQIEICDAKPRVEKEATFERVVGYDHLSLRFEGNA